MTIFLSAFLLFQVQPLIGKAILPWFGGTPAVWMTCMLFFQVALLLGYVYAHWLASRRSAGVQGALHLALLALTLVVLPIVPSAAWKPETAADPTLRILGLLALTVGLPFLALASTGPLLQAWFARRHPGRSPWRLYALSNAGSLLGLLTYPFLVEPHFSLAEQMRGWSLGHAVFAVLCAGWALRAARTPLAATAGPTGAALARAAGQTSYAGEELPVVVVRAGARGAAEATGAGLDDADRPAPDGFTFALWLLLAASASALLLATTNQICQNVAPVPFLWILPLSLYLLTFILCFDGERWARRDVVGWLVAAAFLMTPIALVLGPNLHLTAQIGIAAFTLFACAMACHGELVRLRPGTRHLTSFYLAISAGGALGGTAVAVVAPRVFDSLMEYPASLAACCVALLVARRRDTLAPLFAQRLGGRPLRLAGVSAALLLLGTAGTAGVTRAWSGFLAGQDVLVAERNFFGMLQVGQTDADDPGRHAYTLKHGTTLHGVQFRAPGRRGEPTAYYGPESGLDHALRRARARHPDGLSIGVVGMGVATAAAWAGPGDRVTFYEIDPEVVALARAHFTFWDDAEARGAALEARVGDGRLLLERELAAGRVGAYDLLVVDAFSSDAIPMHLLTEECLDVYRAHMAPDGLLAVHVSNHYLDMAAVVRAQAVRLGLSAELRRDKGDMERSVFPNEWVLVGPPGSGVDPGEAAASWPADARTVRPWTDDACSLLPLLK